MAIVFFQPSIGCSPIPPVWWSLWHLVEFSAILYRGESRVITGESAGAIPIGTMMYESFPEKRIASFPTRSFLIGFGASCFLNPAWREPMYQDGVASR